jgi:uncharacterized protein (TIGR02598 family)
MISSAAGRIMISSGRTRAFSLVEVMFALSIFSFVITALLGLLTFSLDTERVSASDTVIATMTTTVLAEIRREPFDDLDDDLRDGKTIWFFREDGVPCAEVESLYVCKVKCSPSADAGTESFRANLIDCVLRFEWPRGAAQPQTRSILARIARHEQTP